MMAGEKNERGRKKGKKGKGGRKKGGKKGKKEEVGKMDKRDELPSVCSNISSNMFKIALKKHHFKPYFQKKFRGPRALRKCLGPSGLGDVSALRASEISQPCGPKKCLGPTGLAEVGEKRASCREGE